MKRNRIALALAGALTAGTASLVAAAGASVADTANPYDPTFVPNSSDLVGVGSDTTEIVMHGIAEAYSTGKSSGRIASWAADGTPSQISLRSGATAIVRPNGSGAGKALLYGATNDPNVSFARSSSTLSTAESNAGLVQVPFAVDGLKMAVDSASTDAPASLTAAQLVGIYSGSITNWKTVGGVDATIHPLIPQAGSGTRSFFTAQLTAANGGNPVTLGSNVTETQEHSDTDIKADPAAVAPFSTARAKSLSTISLLGGASWTRAVYNVFRTSDLAGANAGEIDSIFGAHGYICSPTGEALVKAAGFDQLASIDAGGECGDYVTDPTTNLTASSDKDSWTTISSDTSATGSVTLTAAVSGFGSAAPVGSVDFYEGDTKLTSSPVAVTNGSASFSVGNVSGPHTYTARFVPTDPTAFHASTSDAVTVARTVSTTALTLSPASVKYGTARKASVTVSAGDVTPTGSVTVKVGTTLVKTIALAGGKATVTLPATTKVGSSTVTAAYAGTDTIAGSSKTATLKVVKASSTISLSLSPTKVKTTKHAKATVTVKIAGASSGVYATGKVTLKSGSKTVGTGTLSKGKVVISVAKLKKGTYHLKAVYAGSTLVGAKTSTSHTLKSVK